MPDVTLLWAGVLGIMSIALAFSAGSLRGKTGVSLGDGGNPDLLLAMRRHGNFVEFVPLALILMALLEISGLSDVTIHVFGGILVTARVCHALGLKSDTVNSVLRGIGAGGTTLLTVVMSVWAIWRFF
ncbi:MAG: MAPEG family protein [Pseudomonadota bacterium]